MHRPRERPASKERHLPLTIPEVTAHLHRVKNIIVKMHLQKATSRNGDRNPGPGSAFANRWPRPGRKLPTRGESGTRHIPPHMQTQIWLSSTWFGVHTGANMGTQAALQARCHFRETLENPRAQ